LQELVNLDFVLLKSGILNEVMLRNQATHLGVAELDNTLAEVAQVLEKVVVVGIHELTFERVR